jgi:uncharacterized protein YceK
MFNNSKKNILTATLIASLMLFSSGCMSIGSDFFCDDRPYQGTKFGIIMIGDYLSGGQATDEWGKWGIGVFVLLTIDLPFSFVVDTVRLPIDVIEISKYPKYHGRVLHGKTGEAMSGVVVMAAAKIIERRSPLTREEWREDLRITYRLTGSYDEVHRIGNRNYGCVATTRTNKNGEFVFKLKERLSIAGFVALKKGYKDTAWQQSDGYHDVEVPTLYLIPEAN